jgi:hypothetical protein
MRRRKCVSLDSRKIVVIAITLLLGTAAYLVGSKMMQKSAADHIKATLPALLAQGTDAATIDVHTFAGAGEQQPMALAGFRQELGNLAVLGEARQFTLTRTVLRLDHEVPYSPRLTVYFSGTAVFAGGPVKVDGGVRPSWDGHWSYAYIRLEPQGTAAQAIVPDDAKPFSLLADTNGKLRNQMEGDEFIINFSVASYLANGGTSFLDRGFEHALTTDERMDDGTTSMYMLGGAIEASFNQKVWPIYQEHIEGWRQRSPQSGPAAITEALFWYHYAWDARDDSLNNTVSKAQAQLYLERMRKAQQVLVESKSYAAAYPLWYSTYMKVARDLNQPELIGPAFEEARQRFPYFEGIYYAAVTSLSPKWGGSYAQEDAMIKSVAEQTKAREGMGFYARLYWNLDTKRTDYGFDLFRDTPAQWPLMKQGFDDLMQRYPGSKRLLNNYAAFACRAGDRGTLNTLLAQMKGEVIQSAWYGNRSYDLCKQMASGMDGAATP